MQEPATEPRRPSARPGRFRRPRRKVCLFCAEKISDFDYKQMAQTRFRTKLMSERGKIVPRRTTGTCASHQRMVSEAIKQARHMAIVPYVAAKTPPAAAP